MRASKYEIVQVCYSFIDNFHFLRQITIKLNATPALSLLVLIQISLYRHISL